MDCIIRLPLLVNMASGCHFLSLSISQLLHSPTVHPSGSFQPISPTISDKVMGKTAIWATSCFYPLPPLNNVEKQRAKLASSYVMGSQHCIGHGEIVTDCRVHPKGPQKLFKFSPFDGTIEISKSGFNTLVAKPTFTRRHQTAER